jgi:hypothetical protein
MGNVISSKTKELIEKALLSKSDPLTLALQLHHRGVSHDEAKQAAESYAERSGKDSAKVLAIFSKVYPARVKHFETPGMGIY